MPATEQQVGITETLGEHEPFRAIVKQRIEDFLVEEVLLNGDIARLTELPKYEDPKNNTNINKDKDNDNDNNNNPSNESPVVEGQNEIKNDTKINTANDDKKQNNDEIKQKVATTISDDKYKEIDSFFDIEHNDQTQLVSSQIKHMLINLDNASTTEEKNKIYFDFPVCTDKSKRSSIHQWVRENLSNFLSETVENKNKSKDQDKDKDKKAFQIIRMKLKSSICPSKRRRSQREELQHNNMRRKNSKKSFEPFQFILWKRDMDTNMAIQKISRILRCQPQTISYAGTKDKRAITTQLMQVKKVRYDNFVDINRAFSGSQFHSRSLAVGNVKRIERNSNDLHLGDLKGNRFTIVLRDVEAKHIDNIDVAMHSLKHYGFINYFGMQRFGSGVSPTHETGFALLRNDYKDVCRRLLLPLTPKDFLQDTDKDKDKNTNNVVRNYRKDMIEALNKFAKNEIKASELLRNLPKRMLVEQTIVSSFCDDEHKNKSDYDYKLAFNKLPRNLRSMYSHAVQSYLFNLMASVRIKHQPPNSSDRIYAIKGDFILVDSNNDGIDDDNSLSYQSKVKLVSKDEEISKAYPITKVVLPVIGSRVQVPQTKWGEAALDVLEQEKIDLEQFLHSDNNLKGTYRFLIAMPNDVEWQLTNYSTPQQSLTPHGIEHLPFKETGNQREDRKESDKRKNVESSKNTTDSADDKQSKDDALVKSEDAEMAEGKKQVEKKDCDEKLKDGENKNNNETHENKDDKNDNQNVTVNGNSTGDETNEPKTALILSFTLSCAQYATMLVRELTKQDSSTASQKRVQNELS